MTTYPIKRWSVGLTGNSVTRTPLIFVEPDPKFLETARTNNFVVKCQVKNTNTIYDKHSITGIVNQSSNIPNCRPNFFAKTGLYVIRLLSNWYGYPNENNKGIVEISNLN